MDTKKLIKTVLIPLLVSFGSVSFSQAVTVDDIQAGYENERKYIDKLIEAIKIADEKQVEMNEIEKTSAENQIRNQGNMMTMDKQTQLLQKQMANYTKMEIQRAESVMLQTKEVIFEDWKLSSQISRREINEIFLEKSQKRIDTK